jgi:hypothetical protein
MVPPFCLGPNKRDVAQGLWETGGRMEARGKAARVAGVSQGALARVLLHCLEDASVILP